MKYISVVLISSILFGIINALFEIFVEKELEDRVIFHTDDPHLANMMSSALAGASAIIIYSYVEIYINSKEKKIPFYDSIGVLLGSFVVYFTYKHIL